MFSRVLISLLQFVDNWCHVEFFVYHLIFIHNFVLKSYLLKLAFDRFDFVLQVVTDVVCEIRLPGILVLGL